MSVAVAPYNFELIDQTGSAIVGASIIIDNRITNQIVVPYTDGTASTYNPNLQTDVNGRAVVWLPIGGYVATFTSPALPTSIIENFDVIPYSALNIETPNVKHVQLPGSTYNVETTDDVVLLSTTSGSFNVQLPTAIGWETELDFTVTTSGNNNTVALITTGGQTVNGITSSGIYLGYATKAQYISVTLVSDQSNWYII